METHYILKFWLEIMHLMEGLRRSTDDFFLGCIIELVKLAVITSERENETNSCVFDRVLVLWRRSCRRTKVDESATFSRFEKSEKRFADKD